MWHMHMLIDIYWFVYRAPSSHCDIVGGPHIGFCIYCHQFSLEIRASEHPVDTAVNSRFVSRACDTVSLFTFLHTTVQID